MVERHSGELVLKLAHQRHDLTARYVLEPLNGIICIQLHSGKYDLEVGRLLPLVTVIPAAFRCADVFPAQQLAQVSDFVPLEIVPLLDCLQLLLVLVFDQPLQAVWCAQALHVVMRLRVAQNVFAWHRFSGRVLKSASDLKDSV